ncbi:uncharacterized protein MONBRDRAFT_6483 [Monosiga brevicollis MX1]|uniref:Cytochrome b5 heme-binding domain-containing protein n=1 Tax=Monosiga brevicollis TaxID=81824 RepID=A9UU07_MONBE|nr:uncharacterized protein MONBRDRAFT_6483 [Monosiga brevicollis MX1]EDQ91338.1 predicted protein [Monosiga brevicollis MX1]|eukprot:XP_001743760.1 hypothetical protein [Monosiga brevicollis MX1]
MKICIDQEWYDLTKWAKYHPGGVRILERFDNQDATDHFYSLHSTDAIRKFKAMRPTETKEDVPEVLPIDASFRELRAKLMDDGWWDRDLLTELGILIPIFAMCIIGTALAWSHPVISVLLISVGMQQAGWLGHDMTHARDSRYNDFWLRYVSGWLNGFDRNWWSNKHNTHHVLTNHVNHDPDIHVQPILYLWAPLKQMDHFLRKYQYIYFPLPYTLLFASWRLESLKWSIANRDYKMFFLAILPGYVWLALLPFKVVLASILVSGFLVAIVVTMSHESEELLLEREPSYVTNQFLTTRDVQCLDWVTEYLFGGMQYQLEHHLFPTMPRYKYRALVPIVRQWAKANGLVYKSDTLPVMLGEHVATLKKAGEMAHREDTVDPYALS